MISASPGGGTLGGSKFLAPEFLYFSVWETYADHWVLRIGLSATAVEVKMLDIAA